MNFSLTLIFFLIWPQVKVMTWSEKIMLHINRSVWSAWTHLWYFHCSSWSLSKIIAEKLLVTFHDLTWPWRHGEGSLAAIFQFRVSSLPVTRHPPARRGLNNQILSLNRREEWYVVGMSIKLTLYSYSDSNLSNDFAQNQHANSP